VLPNTPTSHPCPFGPTSFLAPQLLAPLIRHRFETSLADEWSALAGAANNLPSPGGPVLRIASSMSASQARHVPSPLLVGNSQANMMESEFGGRREGAARGRLSRGPRTPRSAVCEPRGSLIAHTVPHLG
jgi:hypothetical protein